MFDRVPWGGVAEGSDHDDRAGGRASASRRPALGLGAWIGPWIAAGGGDGQPVDVVGPSFLVRGALFGVGQPGMRHAQERAAVPVDQVDLDQARSRRNDLAALPTEALGETMDRHDLAEGAASVASPADAFDEVESTRMRLSGRVRAHPAQDLLGIGQEGAAMWVTRRTTSASFISRPPRLLV